MVERFGWRGGGPSCPSWPSASATSTRSCSTSPSTTQRDVCHEVQRDVNPDAFELIAGSPRGPPATGSVSCRRGSTRPSSASAPSPYLHALCSSLLRSAAAGLCPRRSESVAQRPRERSARLSGLARLRSAGQPSRRRCGAQRAPQPRRWFSRPCRRSSPSCTGGEFSRSSTARGAPISDSTPKPWPGWGRLIGPMRRCVTTPARACRCELGLGRSTHGPAAAAPRARPRVPRQARSRHKRAGALARRGTPQGWWPEGLPAFSQVGEPVRHAWERAHYCEL